MAIDKLNQHYSFTNPASIYDEEALTALELAGRTTAKINEAVEAFNTLEAETTKAIGDHITETTDAINNHVTETSARLDAQDKAIPVEVRNTLNTLIANGEFESEIEKHLGNLNERVDNLLGTLQEGSTTGDAELIDMRTDVVGTTHANAGLSMRTQFNDLYDNNSNPNLIENYHAGEIDASNAFVNPTEETRAVLTDYIPVESGATYTLSFNYPSKTNWATANGQQRTYYNIKFYNSYKANVGHNPTYFYDTQFSKQYTMGESVVYVRIMWWSYNVGEAKFEKSINATHIENDNSGNIADVRGSGYYTATGLLVRDSGEDPTELENQKPVFTKIKPIPSNSAIAIYSKYYRNNANVDPWSCCVFYDADGTFIERKVFTGDALAPFIRVTPPANACYVAFAYRSACFDEFACYIEKADTEKSDSQKLREHVQPLYNYNISVDNGVKGVAHRGLPTVAPENTLPAFIEAFKRGFKYVECDVAFTSDGVPVLLHDDTVDRTSNLTGSVTGMTLAQLKNGDFGSWYSSSYTGTKIPALDEFLSLCRSLKLHPYIELKTMTVQQVKTVAEIVHQYGMTGRVTYIAYNIDLLREVIKYDAFSRVGLIVDSSNPSDAQKVNQLKTATNSVFVDCLYSNTTSHIGYLKKNNIPLEVWTVDDSETIKALPSYVTGVTSNTLNATEVLKTAILEG